MIESFQWVSTGYCTAHESVAYRNGSLRKMAFPAHIGLFKHREKGLVLFDTGYSKRFFEATQAFPFRLYRYATPVFLDGFLDAREHVEAAGADPADVRHIIVSHFHGDHVCGLRDFPNATFYCHERAAAQLRRVRGFSAVRSGILPALLPDDFWARCVVLPEKDARPDVDFGRRWDLFGDGSLDLVDLPGHGCGQLGLRFQYLGQPWFLVADAAWTLDAISTCQLPSPVVRLFFDDWAAFKTTLQKLHQYAAAHPAVRMVPTHALYPPADVV